MQMTSAECSTAVTLHATVNAPREQPSSLSSVSESTNNRSYEQ